MHVLIGIALKSVLIAGIALGLLELMKQRSASERSWVAHIGLLALVLVAVAPLALPNWNVEAPALLGSTTETTPATLPIAGAPPSETAKPIAPAIKNIIANAPAPNATLSATATAVVLYAIPAAILLIITILALGRLIALRARADVLVDGHWLSALARAQRRMGFKHGTALLTSDELASPISWGLMRPVILLNTRAVEASGEAEAIIAHELAHVARMDWAKLLLARIATALFWFNPLVWILAREAHQLREEAADDAVLAADIADTDYAQLLVGVARHECPGLLLGAHGVAPSKNSLARRVARVLDVQSVRGPVARSFAVGVLVGAVLVAAPLAALTLTPGGTNEAAKASRLAASEPGSAASRSKDVPTDLPSIIASGVSTAVSAVAPGQVQDERAAAIAEAVASATKARDVALAEAGHATAQARAAVRTADDERIDAIVEMHAAGVTADYVNAMRAAQPRLRNTDPAEFAGMKAIGVTPEFARDLAAAGLRNLDEDGLTEARGAGLTGDYARGLAAAGIPPNLDDYIQLRAVGVPLSYIISLRNSGHPVRDADKLTEMWAVGVKPGELGVRAPKVPPPGWDPFADDAGDG